MLINFALFQISWFACVLGGARNMPWYGVGVALFILILQISISKNRLLDIRLVVSALGLGVIFDAIPLHMGWITFPAMPYWSDALAPLWMLALWAMLASTLNMSLAWLKPKPILSILLGATSGPLAYLGGARLGAMQIHNMQSSMIYLALGWGFAMWFLFRLSHCSERQSTKT
jgi:hypothetical protein